MITPRDNIPGRRFLIFFLRSCNVAQYVAALTVMPVSTHSNTSGSSTSKKHINMTLPGQVDERTFCECGDEGCHLFMLMLLVGGSK
ncbi:hypothetical protein NPIL_186191 [Nephila pilipes]|uniref:Secreted protein n=1 Tax=Nephila pilipes TaxID=299642 RepID=A0A8X6MNJ4_NEPPI|nr:hypothetical protein NPIL_186191 [Nephila pilipes]